MNKIVKIVLILCAFLLFLLLLSKKPSRNSYDVDFNPLTLSKIKPKTPVKIAIIFDDLGDSLKDLKEIYSLGIPLTVSVIPDRKFSKNIAHIAKRVGFSVLVHIPMEPKKPSYNFLRQRKKFIGSHLSRRENLALVRHYLNSIPFACGANNHMGSKATEDVEIMKLVLKEVKKRRLVFVDSCTSLNSVACRVAKDIGVTCYESKGFLDSCDDYDSIKRKLEYFIKMAKNKREIIIIAHPKTNTIKVLKENIPFFKEEVKFVTLEELFK